MNWRLPSPGFLRDETGSNAVEFALVSVLVLIMLLGIIDMARFTWELNAQKAAARAGARYAAVHPPAATELVGFSALTTCSLGGGLSIPTGTIPDFTCTSTGCTKSTGYTCTNINSATLSTTNFNNIVDYMKTYDPRIAASNVKVVYRERGLGIAGSPSSVGTDVSPLITVSLQNIVFQPIALKILGITLVMPSVSTTMTAEDMA
jgi:hypothetical protein